MVNETTTVGQDQQSDPGRGDAQPQEITTLAETEGDPRTSAPVAEGDDTVVSQPATMEALKPGMRVRGKVRNIVDFGAFIDVGVGRDGLAHVSTLKRAGIDKALKVGDVIDVQIRRVDLATNRISLAVPGAGKGSKTSLQDLEVETVTSGRVVRLVDFGAFVDIGAQTDGLLHVSQLGQGRVGHPSDVLKVGEEIQVRILEVDADRRRISLSLRRDAPTQAPQREAPQREASRREAPRREAPRREAPRREASRREAPRLETSEPGENRPTAFQLAWEEAVSESRGRGETRPRPR